MGLWSSGRTVTRSAGVCGLLGDECLDLGGPGGGMSAIVGGTGMDLGLAFSCGGWYPSLGPGYSGLGL